MTRCICIDPTGKPHKTCPVHKVTKTKVTVVEIDINGKYVFQFPANTRVLEVERAKKIIDEWLEGDEPICFLTDAVKIVRVDDD